MSTSRQPSLGARPPRIGLVTGSRSFAELLPLARHLLIGLLDEPVRITLIAPAEADLHTLPAPPVEVVRWHGTSLPLLRGRLMESLIEQLSPLGLNLLHALDEDALDLTCQLAGRLDVGFLAGAFSLNSHPRLAEGRCQGILAAAEPVRDRLVSSRLAPAQMVHLLRPGVYPARNATCFVNPNYAPAIVAAGQFSALEPFAAVLEAFSRLNQRGPEAVFFLIGNGRYESQLRRLAERMGLLNELTFVDRANQENLTEILRAADIFISPLGRQRVDLELLSAMAAGTPVLAAGAEACDFVVPDQTALTFTAGDAEAIGDRLKMLLADRAFARQLAENALAHLREHHSPARIAGELAKVYLAESARPARA